ncbi:MAG TPA: OmpA family protein [Terriglobales bacterium]|nr:OmpA family protein [Terriglobales bacterium]
MKSRRVRISLVLLLTVGIASSGCGRTFAKPLGKGTWIPAAVCSVVGAGAGIGIKEATRGESSATIQDSEGNPIRRESEKDDPDYWIGAIPGAVIGAVVCGLLGHWLLDEERVAPLPPPPPPMPLPPPASKRIVLRGVNFDFDKNEIRPDSQPMLNAAIRILRENPDVRIAIEGHTDAVGSDDYNNRLSMRRAEAVFQYLVNGGIDPERMMVAGYGKTRPVASNETASGRAQNRRVELQVVSDPQ